MYRPVVSLINTSIYKFYRCDASSLMHMKYLGYLVSLMELLAKYSRTYLNLYPHL